MHIRKNARNRILWIDYKSLKIINIWNFIFEYLICIINQLRLLRSLLPGRKDLKATVWTLVHARRTGSIDNLSINDTGAKEHTRNQWGKKKKHPFCGNRKSGQAQACYVQIIFFLTFLWKNNYPLPLELRKLFHQKMNRILSSTIALVLKCLNSHLPLAWTWYTAEVLTRWHCPSVPDRG